MKKIYVKPETHAYEMEPCVLLAASPNNVTGVVGETLKDDGDFDWGDSNSSDEPSDDKSYN